MAKVHSERYIAKFSVDNYFAGFLYCGACCKEIKKYSYSTYERLVYKELDGNFFQCEGRREGTCNNDIISDKELEKALIEYFSRYDETFLTDSKEAARMEREKRKTDKKIQGYKDKLQHLEAREKEVMNFYINGEIEFENYRDIKKQLESDKEFIRAELSKYTAQEDENQPATINREEIAATFKEGWQELTNPEKRLFLTNYIKKIVVRNDPVEGSKFGNTKIIRVEFNSF